MERKKSCGRLEERTKTIRDRDLEKLYSINFETDLWPLTGIMAHSDRCAPIFGNSNVGKRVERLTAFNALTLCIYNSALLYVAGYGLRYLGDNFF